LAALSASSRRSISLDAYFLAAVQVIVYAGAIVVLFLFVIMLLGVDRVEDLADEPLIGQRQLALLAGAGLIALAVIVGVATSGGVTGEPPSLAQLSPDRGGLRIDSAVDTADGSTIPPEQNIREVGRALFSTRYLFAFEITALLLTVAVVGAVVLARRPRGELEDVPDVDPPWNVRITDSDADVHAAADGEELMSEQTELEETS
jgi:NADH-quinone oxidoreductase subunit J